MKVPVHDGPYDRDGAESDSQQWVMQADDGFSIYLPREENGGQH